MKPKIDFPAMLVGPGLSPDVAGRLFQVSGAVEDVEVEILVARPVMRAAPGQTCLREPESP